MIQYRGTFRAGLHDKEPKSVIFGKLQVYRWEKKNTSFTKLHKNNLTLKALTVIQEKESKERKTLE